MRMPFIDVAPKQQASVLPGRKGGTNAALFSLLKRYAVSAAFVNY